MSYHPNYDQENQTVKPFPALDFVLNMHKEQKEIEARLKEYVSRETSKFNLGVEFHWFPQKGDGFKDFVKWLFHVKHKQTVLYPGLTFEGAYIH